MLLLLTLLTACLQTAEPPLDTVTMKGGKELQGIVLFMDEKTVILGQKNIERQLKRSSLLEMRGPRLAYPRYISKLEQVYSARAEADDAVELAEWCTEFGFPRDVDLHYWRALDLDPDHAEANLALGHRQRSGQWVCPAGSGVWISLQELESRRLEKAEFWGFTTAHFNLIACSSLHDVLRSAATLEILYYHFFDLLQPLAGFYELRQPITVNIYRDRETGYPDIGASLHGYLESSSGMVHTWYEEGEAVFLTRVLSHALQFHTVMDRSKGPPEQYPGWLWEGLATYFEGCYQITDGVPDYLPGRMQGNWLHLHAQTAAKERLGLDALLNFNRNELGAAHNAQLAFAEAYTLCLFLLQNESISTIDSLKKFLHAAYLDQGTAAKFRKSFSKRQRKKLQADWDDFVLKADLRLQQ